MRKRRVEASSPERVDVPMWRIRYFDERRARWVTDFTGLYATEADASAARRIAEHIWPDVDHEVICV